jgi:uncharacterized protein (TIGR03437 family)
MNAKLILFVFTAMMVRSETLLVRTNDGGKTWFDIDPGPPHFFLEDLVATPDESSFYAVTGTGGFDGVGFLTDESHLLVSRDAGRSWLTLRSRKRPESIKFAFDPSNPRTVYLVSKTDRGIAISKSTDAGETFGPEIFGAQDNVRGLYMSRCAVDPVSPSTLYVTLAEEEFYGGGLLKSTDGGESWSLSAGGAVWDLDFAGAGSSTLYLTGVCLGEQFCFAPSMKTNVYRSTDGGRTLERRSPPCESVTNVAVDASLPSVVYASCWDGSLWKSLDEAGTWRPLQGANPAGWWILSANGSRVFARGWTSNPSLQRSDDGGQTWVTILENMAPGLLFASADTDLLLAGSWIRQQPIIASRRIYHRNYAGFDTLAPGMIASIYGNDLTTGIQLADPPLPVTLAGAKVELNGQAAPLFYASPTQINFQVPFSINGAATLEVQRSGGSSDKQTVSVYLNRPFVLTEETSAGSRPLILHEDGFTRVTESAPAAPGETVVLHFVGLGDLEPPLPAGTLPAADRRHWLKRMGEIWLYSSTPGIPLRLEPVFFGASPTQIGVYVLELRLPASLSTETYRIRQIGPARFDVAIPVR